MHLSIKSLIKNASYLLVGTFGNMAISLLHNILVARALGSSNLGIWASVVSFCTIVQGILTFRTKEALTRYLVEYKTSNNKNFINNLLATASLIDLITNFASFLVIIIVATWGMEKLVPIGEKYTILYWIYGLSITLNFIDNLWYCVARDTRKLNKLAALRLVFISLQLLASFILYLFEILNLQSLSLIILLISFLKLLVVSYTLNLEVRRNYQIVLWKLPWKNVWQNRRDLKGFWLFMKATYVSFIFSTLFKRGDILILSYFSNTSDVGIYQIAKSISQLVKTIVQQFSSVIYQDFNEMISHNKINNISRDIKALLKIWIPVVLSLMLVCALLSKPIIILLYGEEFGASYQIFIILLIGSFVVASSFWVQPVLLAFDKYSYNSKVVSIGSVFGIVLIIIFTNYCNSIGTSAAVSLGYLFIQGLLTYKALIIFSSHS